MRELSNDVNNLDVPFIRTLYDSAQAPVAHNHDEQTLQIAVLIEPFGIGLEGFMEVVLRNEPAEK